MCILMIISVVAWTHRGNGTLQHNWSYTAGLSGRELTRQLFKGICISFLGVTGFECKLIASIDDSLLN